MKQIMVYVGLIQGVCYYSKENIFLNEYGYRDCSYWNYLPLDKALEEYSLDDIQKYPY